MGEEQGGLTAGLSVLVPRDLKRWVVREAANRTRQLGVKVSIGTIVRAALEEYRQAHPTTGRPKT